MSGPPIRRLDPVIRLPGLAEPTDVDRLVEGYRRAIDLASAPGVRRLCAGPVLPGPDEPAIADVVRARAYSIPHVVGTCAMGPDPADGAVVDAGGRVHGLAGLIVADASIIPLPPSGFSHIPTIMVAERIAELVVGREGSGA